MLIDKYVPEFDYSMANSKQIHGSKRQILSLLHDVNFNKSWLMRILFTMRGVSNQLLTLEKLIEDGLVVLEETEDEIIIGLIGQPWKWNGNVLSMTPDEFIAFREPNFMKIAMNFYIESLCGDDIQQVITVTRIYGTNKKAKKMFSRYWMLISPFSSIIRYEMLRVIKRELEE